MITSIKSSIVAVEVSKSVLGISGLKKDQWFQHTVLVSHQHFTVEDFVVAEHVVDHLLVQVLGWCLEGNLHTAGLLWFHVDVAEDTGQSLNVSRN